MNKLLFLFALLVFQSSCKRFCKCDPEPSGFTRFKIINNNDQNLLFGNAAKFRIDSLRILAKDANGILEPAAFGTNAYDSSYVGTYLNSNSKLYLYLSLLEPLDSLEVSWKPVMKKCCGERYQSREITELRFNGKQVNPGNNIYSFVK
jgi:hypothetical protein